MDTTANEGAGPGFVGIRFCQVMFIQYNTFLILENTKVSTLTLKKVQDINNSKGKDSKVLCQLRGTNYNPCSTRHLHKPCCKFSISFFTRNPIFDKQIIFALYFTMLMGHLQVAKGSRGTLYTGLGPSAKRERRKYKNYSAEKTRAPK